MAPLKLRGAYASRFAGGGRFRAYKSVAPLKPHVVSERYTVNGGFPRLQKRGPIEARWCSRRGRRCLRFHAYKSVAPLKPLRSEFLGRPPRVFPRLQKRGPIEARS